jgi:hypothetical protein
MQKAMKKIIMMKKILVRNRFVFVGLFVRNKKNE